jgi:HTH-type transcriptional regulator/antitoxin HigA
MELRPIRTETDYQAAIQEIELLFDAAPHTPEYDRLDVLSTLVEAYEKAHFPIEMPDPIEAIHYYMDIRELHQELGIPAEILIQQYESVQTPA